MRRIPGRCYFCGDPTLGEWFCAAHLWAETQIELPTKNGIGKITRDHAFWIEKFTPEQIVELAGYLEPLAVAV